MKTALLVLFALFAFAAWTNAAPALEEDGTELADSIGKIGFHLIDTHYISFTPKISVEAIEDIQDKLDSVEEDIGEGKLCLPIVGCMG